MAIVHKIEKLMKQLIASFRDVPISYTVSTRIDHFLGKLHQQEPVNFKGICTSKKQPVPTNKKNKKVSETSKYYKLALNNEKSRILFESCFESNYCCSVASPFHARLNV